MPASKTQQKVTAKIYSREFLIGTAELIIGDKSMGAVYGNFEPNELYFEKIQKHVWKFWKSNKPDYEKWYSLRFNVKLENGIFLFPQGGYTFDDVEDLQNETIRIDIAGIDCQIIEDNFLTESTTVFVEEPWSVINIKQKIAFEDELVKEFGNNKKTLFNIFKRTTKEHTQTGTEFSAFCHDQRNDDVLFEIQNSNRDDKFVLVHLTWTGKKEQEGYPKMEYFKDYNEFVTSRMIPDKIDWES